MYSPSPRISLNPPPTDMYTSPYVVNIHARGSRVYRLLTLLQLRHLIVVDNSNRVFGIISRSSFAPRAIVGERAGPAMILSRTA
jgi:hypothetical protein